VTVSTWESPDQRRARSQRTTGDARCEALQIAAYLLVEHAVSVQDIESFDGL
jgi:hypothetical protein